MLSTLAKVTITDKGEKCFAADTSGCSQTR